MRFFTIFEGQSGEGRIAITINLDHLVEVVHDGDNLIVHMSDAILTL